MVKVCLLIGMAMMMVGCASTLTAVTDSLNERQVNSCFEANVNVGSPLANNGMVRVVGGTGGVSVNDCFEQFRGNRPPTEGTEVRSFTKYGDDTMYKGVK